MRRAHFTSVCFADDKFVACHMYHADATAFEPEQPDERAPLGRHVLQRTYFVGPA